MKAAMGRLTHMNYGCKNGVTMFGVCWKAWDLTQMLKAMKLTQTFLLSLTLLVLATNQNPQRVMTNRLQKPIPMPTCQRWKTFLQTKLNRMTASL